MIPPKGVNARAGNATGAPAVDRSMIPGDLGRSGGVAKSSSARRPCFLTLRGHPDIFAGPAASVGGRTDRFIVSGHSAGGGLAAAVSLKATDTDDAKIAFQMPLYPMIDDRQNSASAVGNDAPVWDEEANRLAWSRYLDGVKNVTSYAAAARCTDYTKLPPTITYVGSIEPFRDETKIYVENLRRANVPVEFEVFDGAFHGFDLMVPDAPISRRANQFLMGNFQKFAQRYFP